MDHQKVIDKKFSHEIFSIRTSDFLMRMRRLSVFNFF